MIKPETGIGQTTMTQPLTLPKLFRLSPTEIVSKICRRIHHILNKTFRKRNHIFVKTGPYTEPVNQLYQVEHYNAFQDVPSIVKQVITDTEGPKSLIKDEQELALQSSMWVAFYREKPVGVLHVRKGEAFADWFINLDSTDIVIFRVRTFPQYRGKSIAPFLMNQCLFESKGDKGKAFIDCRIYNHASVRSIEKAGFKRIATMKPITRQDALGL